MSLESYFGYIRTDTNAINAIVRAENKEEAVQRVLERFQHLFPYTEEQITVVSFAEKFGPKKQMSE